MIAGVFFAADLTFFHHAIGAVGAGLATVIANLQVLFVGVIAWLLLGERPSGRLLAYGIRVPEAGRALRPIVIVSLPDGTWRKLGEDCGGRPREWVDERQLIMERFARLNSIALIDTDTGDQRELLESAERSVSNPRFSPDRRWIAFDASRPGEPARPPPRGFATHDPNHSGVTSQTRVPPPFPGASGQWT